MGCSRPSKPSELKLKSVFGEMLNLWICVWYGRSMLEDAKEHVDFIRRGLDEVIALMESEEE